MEKDEIRETERLEIAPMRMEDIEIVAELEKRNFSIPWSANSFLSVLEDDFSYGLVGILDGQIIAYAIFGTMDDYAELWNIAVEENFRRRGIGNRMLHHVIDLCRKSGVSSLFLQVRESNQPAQNLYRKNGFSFVMVQKNYYNAPVEDALVYRLDIFHSS
ncbi:MAG: ribosomal protein S18-alanine N-acetyltransferase [Candidatus Glassbacteria bacterium]